MAVLGGEFAMIVLVSADPPALEALLGTLGEVGSQVGLELAGRSTGPHAANPQGRPYRIECVSLDTPGIVHAVTGLLRRRGINIGGLETETTGAPFTGAPMFHMRIIAIVPPEISLRRLREELAEVAAANNLDITVRPVVSSGEE